MAGSNSMFPCAVLTQVRRSVLYVQYGSICGAAHYPRIHPFSAVLAPKINGLFAGRICEIHAHYRARLYFVLESFCLNGPIGHNKWKLSGIANSKNATMLSNPLSCVLNQMSDPRLAHGIPANAGEMNNAD